MGLKDLCMKLGSVFVKKKVSVSTEDKKKVSETADYIVNNGALVSYGGGPVKVTLMKKRADEYERMEDEKLERMAGISEADPEIRLFLDFVIEAVKSDNEQFLRYSFLELSDPDWNENSIRQNISTWGSVIGDFQKLGQAAPAQTNPSVIAAVLKVPADEAQFLSKKQAIFIKWKSELKSKAQRRKGKLERRGK
ncbi:MAG: hypothetical protein ACP5E4_00570 [Candidatus Aenigmatarchaeota archaeon]